MADATVSLDRSARAEKLLNYVLKFPERKGLMQLADTMASRDFLEAPASGWYHACYPGGLFDHSEHVYRRLLSLNALLPDDKKIPEETAFVVGMFHDLCKVDFYQKVLRSRKNRETGKWEDVEEYNIDEKFRFGHGEKSVFLALQYLPLKPQEALAIRWHMGGFDLSNRGPKEIMEVWTDYRHVPVVLMTHIADNLASYLDESEEEHVKYGEKDGRLPDEYRLGNLETVPEMKHTLRDQLPEIPEGLTDREHYILLFRTFLKERDGSEKLLSYIGGKRSDFFEAPASQQFIFPDRGGACALSLKLFYKLVDLCDYQHWPASLDNIAAVALLHGLGCINKYKIETSKRKNTKGEWMPYQYIVIDEELAYGRLGPKSVYIAQPFIRLSREEAMAIRWIEGALDGDTSYGCAKPFEQFPFAYLAHAAYLLAAFGK